MEIFHTGCSQTKWPQTTQSSLIRSFDLFFSTKIFHIRRFLRSFLEVSGFWNNIKMQ